MKLVELSEKYSLTPSELKRFGDRVKCFNVTQQTGEEFAEAKKRVFTEIEEYVKKTGGQLYTGIHSENDWSRTRWWSKGGHLCNRTLEFVVITK